MAVRMEALRLEAGPDLVVGGRQQVPVLGGATVRYINLDNAASTPPLRVVSEGVRRFEAWYASVHRGSGFKSRLATEAFDRAHERICRFVGMDPETNVAVLVRNTTEALNRLARRFPFRPGDVVLTTEMEHHSNDLPWRLRAQVEYVRVDERGRLLLEDLEAKLKRHDGRVRLVAVTGASNVTGYLNPVHTIARLAHEHGALIAVDAAQLAPHRAIDARRDDDSEHLDFIALSGHKMYAPYGGGALVGPKAFFRQGTPDLVGGGTVSLVTHDRVAWADLPDREEAGSPNVIGAVALGLAMEALERIGMEALAEHEADLTAHALRRLREVPGITIYGDDDPDRARERVGVIPFNLEGIPHALVAAILGHEGGIGVRNGCFCAHPYLLRLLGVPQQEVWRHHAALAAGDKSAVPGLVRASFGCYNTREDVDALVEHLNRIARGEYRGRYGVDRAHGSYEPEGVTYDFSRWLPWG